MQFAGLKTYLEVLRDPDFGPSLVHTLYFAGLSVAATVLLALIISLALFQVQSDVLRNSLTLIYILPTLVSLAAGGVIWDWIMHPRYGLANQMISSLGFPTLQFLADQKQVIPSLTVINVWIRMGFSILILLSGLQSIPNTYFDAAKVDGAKGLKLYWHITLPLLVPQLAAVTLLEIIFSLKVFDIVYVSTQGGPAQASEVLMLYLYNNAFRYFRVDKASVIAVFIFFALLIFGIVQRRLIQGRRYEL
jgi:multiple sugar transport system permease protein